MALRSLGPWGIFLLLSLPPDAQAQEAPQLPPPADRPRTVAQLEAGIIALPGAAISPAYQGGQTPLGPVGKGDATVMTGIHLLFRANRRWAFGAGATFAPKPTSDPNYGGVGNTLSRTHSRSYLSLGGEARFYPIQWHSLEAWVGLTAGAIVVADRFSTNNLPSVPSFLGNSTVTVNTEGFAAGIQGGADYLITDQWVAGVALRAEEWLLPGEKPFFSQATSCDAFGDCPTLTGTVAAFEFALTVGYRIPL